MFAQCLANLEPEKYDPVYVAQIQSSNILRHWVYQDASFTRLREVSVAYQMAPRWAQLVGARASRSRCPGATSRSGRRTAAPGPGGSSLEQFAHRARCRRWPQVMFSLSLSF